MSNYAKGVLHVMTFQNYWITLYYLVLFIRLKPALGVQSAVMIQLYENVS